MSEEELKSLIQGIKASQNNVVEALAENTKATQGIHITLFGVDNCGGCLAAQRESIKAFEDFKEKDYNPFKVRVLMWIAGSAAAGTGIGISLGKAIFGS